MYPKFKKGLVVFFLLFIASGYSFAQKRNWQHLDLKTDSIFGISTEKAYQELIKGKKGKPVLIAVLDGGVDINHEDLKGVIWTNPKEIVGNGKDDDRNGYIDDTHGWNFLSSAKGSVNYETLELTRLVRRDALRFGNKREADVVPEDLAAFRADTKNRLVLNNKLNQAKTTLAGMTRFKNALDVMVKKMGKDSLTLPDFQNYNPTNDAEGQVKGAVLNAMQVSDFNSFYKQQLVVGLEHLNTEVEYSLNVNYDPRSIVGDNPDNLNERSYGSSDVAGPDANHGTHVAGIIGADRSNKLGIKGIADYVKIIVVRCTPNGDERDKDVANSIRYAADNGAKVINMSFGKAYSWDKRIVDEAVKYAMKKDVLVIHAAGNDNKNLEVENNFPNPEYETGGKAPAFITVGASGWVNDSSLKAGFSNYGKTKVDVFAPGVQIQSSVPGSAYAKYDGTSMAAPVVAGLAGLIRSYYPKLTAIQVKEIILKSVVKTDHLKDYCETGGVVNTYNAIKLAATY